MATSTEAVRPRRLTVLEQRSERGQQATPPPAARPAVRAGPLLAVCGLAGGAGTTTLAYLTALTAARQGNQPVLVADTGGSSGGLSELAEVETANSLPGLAAAFAAGSPVPGPAYANGPDGLRVLATAPEFSPASPHELLRAMLTDARAGHALTVIDCGTLSRQVDRVALEAATHTAWVLPATRHGIRAARRVLALVPPSRCNELVVARRETRQAKAALRELRQLADERHAPLVLAPHIAALEKKKIGRALDEAQVPLQAMLGWLRR